MYIRGIEIGIFVVDIGNNVLLFDIKSIYKVCCKNIFVGVVWCIVWFEFGV